MEGDGDIDVAASSSDEEAKELMKKEEKKAKKPKCKRKRCVCVCVQRGVVVRKLMTLSTALQSQTNLAYPCSVIRQEKEAWMLRASMCVCVTSY